MIQGVDNGAETKMEGPAFRSHTARCSQSKGPHRAQLEVEKVEYQLSQVVDFLHLKGLASASTPILEKTQLLGMVRLMCGEQRMLTGNNSLFING